MLQLIDSNDQPGLLVSVRDADEALAALAGGAQVIDVKEPNRGSLGAAETSSIEAVIRAVHGRAPVTAAAGELIDLIRSPIRQLPVGLTLFKIGLAGCSALPDWTAAWQETVQALWPHEDAVNHTVAVAYADWQTANSPEPHEVLRAAADAGCPALLVDTWNKSAGALFDHLPARDLAKLIETAHVHNMLTVLAGSLVGEHFAAAARFGPDLLAVRTAACESGRNGTVSRERVAALRHTIAQAVSVPI